jgi:hypothetical protein
MVHPCPNAEVAAEQLSPAQQEAFTLCSPCEDAPCGVVRIRTLNCEYPHNMLCGSAQRQQDRGRRLPGARLIPFAGQGITRMWRPRVFLAHLLLKEECLRRRSPPLTFAPSASQVGFRYPPSGFPQPEKSEVAILTEKPLAPSRGFFVVRAAKGNYRVTSSKDSRGIGSARK